MKSRRCHERAEGRSAGAAAVKRWYSPSGYAQEKAVVFEVGEGGALRGGEMKYYGAGGVCTSGDVWAGYVLLQVRPPLLGRFSMEKMVVYAGIGTIDCYRACDVRGARDGCLIFTLLVSVLGIDLRAFARRDREGVREGSTSVESASGDTRRGV